MTTIPDPQYISKGEQYFQSDGSEFFLVTGYGRRPDVKDRLRFYGTGATRSLARRDAHVTYENAYRALARAARR